MSEPQHTFPANSFKYGWQGINLLMQKELCGEIPGSEMDLHHKFHFVTVALGNFRARYKTLGGWENVNYQAGDVIILPQSEIFPKVIIDRDVSLLQLFLNAQQMVLLDPGKVLEPQLQLKDQLIKQIAIAIYQEIGISGAESLPYAESMSIALSAHLLKNYSTAQIKLITGVLSKRDSLAVQDYIHSNLTAPLTVGELSNLAGLSIHQFSVLFRRTFGLAPHQYVLKVRIDLAMVLLKTTELPIVHISQQVGFTTQSHFTRVFRQQQRLTPKQYRNLV